MFKKIILRTGIAPWGKLIHNLRASFETDLLNGKYDTPEHRIGIHMIAEWLGHSVKVMLEHYGRSQQSDFDNIAKACERVRQEKCQNAGDREANIGIEGVNLDPFFSQNVGLSVESTGSSPPAKASLNASLNRAVRGGIAFLC